MNRFLDRLAELYAPLGKRGLLTDGQYRFAPDETSPTPSPTPVGARPARRARPYRSHHPKGSITA